MPEKSRKNRMNIEIYVIIMENEKKNADSNNNSEDAASLRLENREERIDAGSQTNPLRERLLWGFSINVIFMGICTLFTDVSGDMITAILPQYLLIIGGGSALIVTFVTSFSTAVANIIQGFAGFLSEHINRRKLFVVLGYIISNMAKPFIGLMTTWEGVLALKVTDRAGKGLRAAPRDTLVAHYATIAQEQAGDKDSHSGRNFGVLRSMDTTGAVIGPIFAFFLLFYYINIVNKPQMLAYQLTILWSIFPGLIGVLFVALVKEIKTAIKGMKKAGQKVDKFPRKLARLILTLSIMQFATIDASYLLIRSYGTSNSPGLFPVEYQAWVVIAYAAYNVVYAVVAFYAGRLGDKMSKQKLHCYLDYQCLSGWQYCVRYHGTQASFQCG